MGLRDTITRLFPAAPFVAWSGLPDPRELTTTNEEIEILFGRSALATTRTYRLPSVKDALGVPAIHGAVSLIAGTTGMLSMGGYRNGEAMDNPPRLITRPDPYSTPQAFYSATAASMAKYGEFVWWIASRDGSGAVTALQLVPLNELKVEENPDNRLRPSYSWGTVKGMRYTAATPTGNFVHVKYVLADPFALRGQGPLQLCNAAASVSVEAQAWAAQFYADGGNPSVIIKHAGDLSPELDEDGLSEADRLRAQWVGRPHNVPRVIDQNIESVEYKEPTATGAQMLEAREHQNGDAARMFRIPGSLLEYQQSGASLTYQNLEGEFTKFVRTCLQPLYLEPIEQAMSDLLTRPDVARFNVKGFLRADIKTRFEVHGLAIDKGIYDSAYARREEGIEPGDIEFAPVPFPTPASVPVSVPKALTTEVRCDGAHPDRPGERCNKLLSESDSFAGKCPRCKKIHGSDSAVQGNDMRELMASALTLLAAAASREQAPAAPTNVELHVPLELHVTTSPTPISVESPTVTVEAPTVNVEAPSVTVMPAELHSETPVNVTVVPSDVTVIQEPAKPKTKRIVRDAANQITEIIEEPTDG